MNILLIYPTAPRTHWPRGPFRSRWIPTGLAYLGAALLRAGHRVKVHMREEVLMKNGFDWERAEEDLRKLLTEFSPEMVGFSVVAPAIGETAHLARTTRDMCGRGTLVVAGGPHASILPEGTLEACPDVDAVVLNEGEETIVELAERGIGPQVNGIVYRDNGRCVRTAPRRRVCDLDELGPPAYELFDMKYYTTPSRWMIRWMKLSAANIRTSRGCTNRCRFCAGHQISGLGVRYHSVEYVMEQALRAVNDFGVEAIHFEDDTLGGDRGRLLEICESMCRLGLHRRVRWDCCLRVDQADIELLRRMKSAGCVQVEYGFESGSDDALRRLGKRSSVELNRRAVSLTRQAGLRIFADIMVGLPGETEREFRRTLRFVRWARAEVLSAARLAPLPGTPIYEQLPEDIKNGIDWADFTYFDIGRHGIHLSDIPPARFDKLYENFQKYVVRPQTIRALLRDTRPEDARERRNLTRRLVRFVLHHPIRAARVPW